MDYQRTAEIHNPYQKIGGTGYLILDRLILTAHHVIAPVDEAGVIGTQFDIRFIGDYEAGQTKWRLKAASLCWDNLEHDLALLKLEESRPDFLTGEEPTIQFGKLGGETLSTIGYGFPQVQLIEKRQNPEPLEGRLSRLAGLKEKQLRLQVTSPVPNRADDWAGISGTALFIEECLVGVIVETNKSFAEKALWATPISLMADDREFCKLVLDNPTALLPFIELPQEFEMVKQTPNGRIFQAPLPPSNYVARPTEVGNVVHKLTKNGSIVCMHGLGGTGKSVLAAAIARDPRLIKCFKDGVMWATLGQNPILNELLDSWIQEIGKSTFRFESPETAKRRLRSLLEDQSLLLVIDDAWDANHVDALLAYGPRCSVLITTREPIVGKAVKADLYELGVMSPEQAFDLLTQGHDFDRHESDLANQLTEVLGYLPLAVELAAAQVVDGVSWEEILNDLRAEIAHLETLESADIIDVTDLALRKRLSVTSSLNLSLRRLNDQQLRAISWLGVLPDDAEFGEAMVTTLWPDDRKPRTTLRYLRSKSLLQSTEDGKFKIHDILHDMAKSLLVASPNLHTEMELPGQGITLQEAHAQLLHEYAKQTKNQKWHTLADDKYIHSVLSASLLISLVLYML